MVSYLEYNLQSTEYNYHPDHIAQLHSARSCTLYSVICTLFNWELVENKSELVEIVSKVRGGRSEERGVRAEWEAPRRGNESIAQWQATSGAAPWGRMSGEMRPVR